MCRLNSSPFHCHLYYHDCAMARLQLDDSSFFLFFVVVEGWGVGKGYSSAASTDASRGKEVKDICAIRSVGEETWPSIDC